MLKYDKQRKRLVNIAVDNRSSPFYALRDRQGNAIGVTACDIDGDGREEIYVLNTNNAFSGTVRADTLLENYKGTHRAFFLFFPFTQRQRRRIGMQILSLSQLSLQQITYKLCAAINLWETQRSDCQNCNTSRLSFFLNSFITLLTSSHRSLFSLTHSFCITQCLFSPRSLCLSWTFSLSASRSGNILWQAV